MELKKLAIICTLFMMFFFSTGVSALAQTDFPTDYLYGTVISEFDSIYMAHDENATIDLDGDTISDLKFINQCK